MIFKALIILTLTAILGGKIHFLADAMCDSSDASCNPRQDLYEKYINQI